jgi:K+-transporting ATPase KdpF subunit
LLHVSPARAIPKNLYAEFTPLDGFGISPLRPLSTNFLARNHRAGVTDVQAKHSRFPTHGVLAMSAMLLWLLIIAVAIYLLVAMLRPDKF